MDTADALETQTRTKQEEFMEEMIVIDRESLALQDEMRRRYGFARLIGVSPAMQSIFEIMHRIRKSDGSVLLLGESGTGKELVARSLHYSSRRRDKPFVPVNCVSIPAGLVESVLFGHRAGSFTGATETRSGLFEVANGGTLFLDEIGDMSLEAQAKLLRVLQERSLTRVGDTTEIPVDIRLVAATSRDLGGMLERGTFREDLFYRMNVILIEIPPLRERGEDLTLLALDILDELADEKVTDGVKRLTRSALDRLLAHPWPGNVRELRNTLERAALLTVGEVIAAADLQFGLPAPAARGALPSYREARQKVMGEFEREYLLRVLRSAGGNISRAARTAGMDRSHLYELLKKHNLPLAQKARLA